MKKNNKEAWDEIKKQGLTVDVQVYPNGDGTHTAYVGGVGKDRWFTGIGFTGKKKFVDSRDAWRDSHAVARAIARETGLPLHPSISPDGQKQVSSHTIKSAQLQVMHDMKQRQMQDEFEESPQGKLLFWITAIVLMFVCTGAVFVATWLMSLVGVS